MCHIGYGMKMTMHIDEALLKRVVEAYGCESKTEAVEMALREMDRRVRFREFIKEGMGMTSEELADAVIPGYDPNNLNITRYTHEDFPSSKVAEDPK
jgi:Arc/MetJ family transcription regulator